VNIATGTAREREEVLVRFVEELPEDDILRTELDAFRDGRSEGSWENFLYFVARLYFDSHGDEGREARRRSEAECGVSHIRSTTALRVPAQIIPLSRLKRERMDPRLGDVVYRVVSLIRAEPPPDLFEIPADYTVVERPMRPGLPGNRPPRGDGPPR
jgi:hypothetical protein